jgi:hypothetical protein
VPQSKTQVASHRSIEQAAQEQAILRLSILARSYRGFRREDSVRDPGKPDQRQEDWDEEHGLVEIVREPEARQHEPQSGRIQNEREQGRMRPGLSEEPEHKQNKEQKSGQGSPQTISKRKSVMIWSGSRVEKVCFITRSATPASRLGSESTNETT